MSTKLIPDAREKLTDSDDWLPAPETAPSTLRQDEPWLARWVGLFGLGGITLGGVTVIANAMGRSVLFGPGIGTLALVLGLGALLYHAISDPDLQIRRTYLFFGLAWLIVGFAVSLGANMFLSGNKDGPFALFVPYGFLCFFLGLMFLMAFLRNETEADWRDRVLNGIGALGATFALVGFAAGNVSVDFLLPRGLLLILLGAFYLWGFVGTKGVSSDVGYLAGLAIGALGLLVFLIALVRSLIPALASWGWIRSDAESYMMPGGLLLMGFGLFYAILSAGLISDYPLVVMTRRELGAIFYSPIAYIVLVGFMVVAEQLFANFVFNTLWSDEGIRGRGNAMSQIEPIIANYIIAWFPIICVIFIVPVITMRLLSEEQRTGTMEVMLTAPIGETSVVLSKFFAAFTFYLLVWLPLGLYLVALRVEGGQSFDYRPLLSFFIALAFSGAGFVSMGLFFSSLTRSQIGAAILTFVGMLLLTFTFFAKMRLPPDEAKSIVLTHVSYIDLWISSINGRLALRDLFYQLSAAVFWLFLTVKVIESRKWR